jgi:DNA-binding NtrC family response regulator
MAQTILVVDDDPVQRRLLETAISRSGMTVVTAPGGQPALDLISGPKGDQITLMLLDLVMPDMGGLEVLAKLRPTNPDLPIIVLTAKGGIDSAVEAIRAGANDFLVKPASPERIAVSIRNQLKIGTLSGEVKQLKKKTDNKLTFDDLIARAIQGTSSRAGKPFVTVNCGAIPENLIESILFGHEKGCFTGASDKHLGKFQEADGGTLFLDEIGELRLDMQVKLLRALQEGEVDPVGSKRPVKVDVRIISATNRDLGQMAREGGFREDLYYRLNVFSIMVPSLRDRASDIAPLAQHFIARFAAEENKAVVGLTQEAAALLESFSWPGNVRQLENTIFRAVVLCDGSLLDVCDFPQIASAMGVEASHRNAFATQAAPVSHGNQGAPALPTGSPYALSATDASGHIRKFEELESEIIRMSIARYDGHMSEVARRLGIGRSTLYRKLKEFGLEPAEDGASEESAIEEAMRKAG